MQAGRPALLSILTELPRLLEVITWKVEHRSRSLEKEIISNPYNSSAIIVKMFTDILETHQ
jgi:hypothetical protein